MSVYIVAGVLVGLAVLIGYACCIVSGQADEDADRFRKAVERRDVTQC